MGGDDSLIIGELLQYLIAAGAVSGNFRWPRVRSICLLY